MRQARDAVRSRIMACTTLNIDRDALEQALALYATDSPSVAVNTALREAVRRAELEDFDAVRDVELELDHERLRAWRDGRATTGTDESAP